MEKQYIQTIKELTDRQPTGVMILPQLGGDVDKSMIMAEALEAKLESSEIPSVLFREWTFKYGVYISDPKADLVSVSKMDFDTAIMVIDCGCCMIESCVDAPYSVSWGLECEPILGYFRDSRIEPYLLVGKETRQSAEDIARTRTKGGQLPQTVPILTL